MPVRHQIAPALGEVFAAGMRLAFDAYDGSTYGPPDAACRINIKDHRALNYVATAPSDLGMARAYAAGYLDVEGDLFETLVLLASDRVAELSWSDRITVLR